MFYWLRMSHKIFVVISTKAELFKILSWFSTIGMYNVCSSAAALEQEQENKTSDTYTLHCFSHFRYNNPSRPSCHQQNGSRTCATAAVTAKSVSRKTQSQNKGDFMELFYFKACAVPSVDTVRSTRTPRISAKAVSLKSLNIPRFVIWNNKSRGPLLLAGLPVPLHPHHAAQAGGQGEIQHRGDHNITY